jgi:hypothetical protein
MKGGEMKRLQIFTLLIGLLFMSGCATITKPGRIPEIQLGTVGAFSEKLSVELINDQPDVVPQVYAGIGGNTFLANYNEWTRFFINNLAEELKKRGADVSETSPNKLKVKLSDFAFIQGWAKVRVNMRISLNMPEKNWDKEWVATDTSGWSGGRAFGSVIYHAIEQLLEDSKFIELLKVNE